MSRDSHGMMQSLKTAKREVQQGTGQRENKRREMGGEVISVKNKDLTGYSLIKKKKKVNLIIILIGNCQVID